MLAFYSSYLNTSFVDVKFDRVDYFNYGFNEETWRAYCERQKRMRVHESGSGLIPMNQTTNNVNIIPNMSVPPPNIMPPMGMNNVSDMGSGSINVIGGMNTRRSDNFAKENTIQVRKTANNT